MFFGGCYVNISHGYGLLVRKRRFVNEWAESIKRGLNSFIMLTFDIALRCFIKGKGTRYYGWAGLACCGATERFTRCESLLI
jgi:hypothetical protein